MAGILLTLATLIALALANSPWSELYFSVGSSPLRFWIDDGLMSAFFLLVGLEIKREVLSGELNTARKAALPLVAALGGMVVPAAIYAAIAGGTAPGGWGVPTATDIAFALGVARLLGGRIPAALLVFLSAFAIADDLGAVAIIALFYGHAAEPAGMAALAGVVAALAGMNRLGISRIPLWLLAGIPLWLAVWFSGLHPTLAGVILSVFVPAGAGEELEHRLHPWVAFGIVPLFALANAGLDLRGVGLADLGAPVPFGIALALLVGKPLGLLGASGIAVRLGIAELPPGVGWGHMLGAGILGGIGFTMSLFVAGLAFEHDPGLLIQARLGILAGSGAAAGVGFMVLKTRIAVGLVDQLR